MAVPDSSSSATQTNPATIATPPPPPAVVTITAHHHIPVKLTPATYTSWRANLLAVLNGFDLIGHIDGSKPCPSAADPLYSAWFRQDQLILAAIFGSVAVEILPMISTASTSAEAWSILGRMYAGKSRARVMQLKSDLVDLTLGDKPVTQYLQSIKAKADELSLIDSRVSDDDLTLYAIKGLGHNYREIVSAIRSRESSLKFEELHDLLVAHELYLKHLESSNTSLLATVNSAQNNNTGRGGYSQGRHNSAKNFGRGGSSSNRPPQSGQPQRGGSSGRGRGSPPDSGRPTIICQWCGFKGHAAPTCRRLNATAHVAQSPPATVTQNSWLVDSGASHSLTNDLSQMSIHSEYDGTDQIQIADGSGLPISHTGSQNGGAFN